MNYKGLKDKIYTCKNCNQEFRFNSQSETFGAKNYGKGRKSRGMKQYG